MLSVLTHLSLCFGASLAGTASTPQGPQAVLEVLPLQAECGQRAGVLPPPWGTMLTYNDPGERPDLIGSMRDDYAIAADHVAELLNGLHADAVDRNKLRLETCEDCLFVFGDNGEVARVRDEVRQLSAVVVRPLQIEVALWPAGTEDGPPAVMTPSDYHTFVGQRQPRWRSLTAAQTSRPVALDQQRWTRYVRDNDTEVAQKESVSVPIADAFCEGGRVVVVPYTLVGGDDLVLHVQFGLAHRRGPVVTLPTGVPGQSDLETPRLETITGACSGRVANGGALAITLRGHASGGGQDVLTVRVVSRTPPAQVTVPGLSILPCGALTSEALRHRPLPPSPYPSDEGIPEFDGDEIELGFGRIESGQLQDLLLTALGDAAEDCDITLASGHLFVRGPDAARTSIEATLFGLQERMLRTATVRHVGRLPGHDADPLLHEIVLPTLMGRQATVCRILETNVLRNLFVEIAQEASVLDPDIAALQVGDWLRVRAAPQGDQLHLQFLGQCAYASPPPLRRNVMPRGGNLMTTDVASVRTNHDGPVDNGQTIDHGDGPTVTLDGQELRSTLATTVRW